MNHAEYARQILAALPQQPASLPPIEIDDRRRRNAARCMAAIACNRLATDNSQPDRLRHSAFGWKGGVFGLRNSRLAEFFWTNLSASVTNELESLGRQQPFAFLFLHWQVEESMFHAWAVPADMAFDAMAGIPADRQTGRKTILISPDDHRLRNAPGAPDFAPFYVRCDLTEAERAKLLEAIKTDDSFKQERMEQIDEGDIGDEVDSDDNEPLPDFTHETVDFLLELPDHVTDRTWHERNKQRYERVLRDPSKAVVDRLRTGYMQKISPVVAGGKRHLSILKKNDYGKGGYHDHYWFAFYDPAAGSKTNSVQLFVHFLGTKRVWGYGFSMGNYHYNAKLVLVSRPVCGRLKPFGHFSWRVRAWMLNRYGVCGRG